MKILLKIGIVIFCLQFVNMTCCSETYRRCLKIRQISLSNMDNSGEFPVEQTDLRIPAKAFTINLSILSEHLICSNSTFPEINLIPSAYATSCENDEFIISDPIVSIEIFCNKLLDTTGSIDSDLSDFFIFPPIQELNDNFSTYDNFFYLVKKPDTEDTVNFIFEVKLQSGKLLRDTTEKVLLGI